MKIREGFVLRRVMGQAMVIAVGDVSREFNGMIKLNDTGRFLWEKLQKDTTLDELVGEVLKSYEIDETDARRYVKSFVEELEKNDFLC